jgi:hypothetical protein
MPTRARAPHAFGNLGVRSSLNASSARFELCAPRRRCAQRPSGRNRVAIPVQKSTQSSPLRDPAAVARYSDGCPARYAFAPLVLARDSLGWQTFSCDFSNERPRREPTTHGATRQSSASTGSIDDADAPRATVAPDRSRSFEPAAHANATVADSYTDRWRGAMLPTRSTLAGTNAAAHRTLRLRGGPPRLPRPLGSTRFASSAEAFPGVSSAYAFARSAPWVRCQDPLDSDL